MADDEADEDVSLLVVDATVRLDTDVLEKEVVDFLADVELVVGGVLEEVDSSVDVVDVGGSAVLVGSGVGVGVGIGVGVSEVVVSSSTAWTFAATATDVETEVPELPDALPVSKTTMLAV